MRSDRRGARLFGKCYVVKILDSALLVTKYKSCAPSINLVVVPSPSDATIVPCRAVHRPCHRHRPEISRGPEYRSRSGTTGWSGREGCDARRWSSARRSACPMSMLPGLRVLRGGHGSHPATLAPARLMAAVCMEARGCRCALVLSGPVIMLLLYSGGSEARRWHHT